MSKELIVSSTRHETRVAVLEDDQLVEIFYQREQEYSLAGSIHKGRVTRVLPGMQSAFVDIGLDRDAFLYVSDFFEDNEEYDKIVSTVEDKVLRLEKGGLPVTAESVVTVSGTETKPAVIAAAPTEPEAPAATASLAVVTPAANSGERREDRDRERRGGRRSRRRRPKGHGGLPESKYFSPRGPRPDEHRPEHRPVEHRAAAEPVVVMPAVEDFAVLPGESLAKYVVSEVHEDARQEAVEASQSETGEPVQPSAVDEAPVPEAASAPEFPETQPETANESDRSVEAEAVEEESQEAVGLEPEDEALDQEAPPESQPAVSGEAGAGPRMEDEGPEPARIPTSLTATLREMGPRYPHRVSRRMRRKMRSGAVERPENSTAAPVVVPEPVVETRTKEVHVPEPRTDSRPEANRAPKVERERSPLPSISDLLREGQEIIVQIAKEPLGQKGARITSHIALPGRFLVYMPTVDHVGVSRKIPSEEERSRLKKILQSNRTGIPGGYIVRTAGEGKTEEELRADMMFLYNLWMDMRQKAEKRPAPMLLHHDLDVVQRILRDQLTSSFKTIWVDNEVLYEGVLRFVQRFQPTLVSRVKLYTRPNPVFDEFNITSELEKALKPKVWLKSGGYIVINQTEALVAIDINTGKYVGKSNRLEDTIVKTNTDAIREIVRQIRLRDLGGIIVVDFIDMDERKNRQKVMQALEEAMRADRAPYKILQFNDFGLVAITRKRVKQSLERTLCAPCHYCEGAGYVKSPSTVIGEILQEAQKVAKTIEGSDVMLRVNPEVGKILKSNQNDFLQEIEEILGKTVIVKSDPMLHQTKFDLA